MDLLNYVKKPKIKKLLSRFVETCTSCGKERRFSYIDSYLSGETVCEECKSRLRLLNIPLPFAIKTVANYFGMSPDEFKIAVEKNITLKKAMLSFLEGIGQYGVCTPQPLGAPFFVIVSVTQKCNLNCSFCYNTEYVRYNNPSEMNTEQVKQIIDKLSDAGCLGIGFNGGEPTLRDDICELVSYANSKDLIPLIATNATLIDKKYAEKLRSSGLCYAQVSLDGNPGTHDFLRGKKGTYKETLKGLKNLVDSGVYVSVAMVVTKKNYYEIEHVLDIAKEYKASKFEILDYQRLGKAEDDIDLSPQQRDDLAEKLCMLWKDVIDKKERISLLYKNPVFYKAMKKVFSEVGTANLFGAAFPEEAMKLFKYEQRMKKGIFTVQDPFSPIATCCEAGFFGLFIDVDGSIAPCPYMPLQIGNIFQDDFHEIWTDSSVLNSLRDRSNLKGDCNSCENVIYCGGCRARAFNFTKDSLSSDPLCSKCLKPGENFI